ncbi:MAG: glycosyltransferase, partial [Isosphaeraceae bacterium]
GLPMAAVLYDFVGFLFQEKYLTWAPAAMRLYRTLERVRGYDSLLAISEATRDDGRRLLGLGIDRIVNISGASDPTFFKPDRSATLEVAEALRGLGIDRPFVFCLASMDQRKNLRGLIDAFRLLPAATRAGHQLVVSFSLSEADAEKIRQYAEQRGVVDSLVLTGEISDSTLRLLYQRCAAFVMPSLYEGFGLPLLEAMHCGAAVIGGNNSSQIEVVGDAGLLANVVDAGDIATHLAKVLKDQPFAERLRTLAVERARQFSWEETARRTLDALTRAASPRRATRRVRADRPHANRPRVAIFSPWPPKKSGIADYALRLSQALLQHYDVDLYHERGYEPDLGPGGLDFGLYDHRLFERNVRVLNYRGVIYQMGNSHYHNFIYDALMRYPGLVTLHDFGLAGFHGCYARQPGAPADHLVREVHRSCPDRAEAILESLDSWALEDGGLGAACTRRGVFLNQSVFDHANRVIVHSPWCLDQARANVPEHADRVEVLSMGATVRTVTPEARAAIRTRFGLADEALIFASFGIIHDLKMNLETITAFEPLAKAIDSSLLLFVGQDLTQGAAERRVEELGLTGRVGFLNHQRDIDYADLIAATDVGVCLRRPPTNGETSAALLDLLRHGVPTIVNNVGTFADYPDDVVRKVNWDLDGIDGLIQALFDLARDRSTLGRSALRHVEENHSWSGAAERFVEIIERCAFERKSPMNPLQKPKRVQV